MCSVLLSSATVFHHLLSVSPSIFLPFQPSLALSRPNRPGNGSPPWLPCQLPAALVVSGGERDNDITLAGLTVLILHFSCLSIPLFLSPVHHSTLSLSSCLISISAPHPLHALFIRIFSLVPFVSQCLCECVRDVYG